MTTSGVALAAASTGSPEGPALAGAIIVAVSAATISSAERKEANIMTVIRAVKSPNTCAQYLRILPLRSPVIPRLAWHFRQLLLRKCPPLLLLSRVSPP